MMIIYQIPSLTFVESEPSGGKMRYEYDSQWRVSKVFGPRDVLQEERIYAALGGTKTSQIKAPVADVSGTGLVKSFAYESGGAGGRLSTETDALGHTTHYAYNTRDQIVRSWGTKVNPVSYEYDDHGRKTKMTAYRDEGPNGDRFHSSNWPTNPGVGDETIWTYDPSTGLLKSKEDAKNQVTEYGYDEFNRPNARLLPNNKLKKIFYNSQTGEVFSQKYYFASSLTQSDPPSDPSTPNVFFAYDRLGNVERVKDGTGERTFTYTDSNEPLTTGLLHGESLELGNGTYEISYDYDSARRRLSGLNHGVNTPTLSMGFGYRSNAPVGLLESITTSGGGVTARTFTYGYQPLTSWIRTISSGNYYHTRGYESFRNMVKSTSSEFNAISLGVVTQTRDALGRIVTLDREDGMYELYSGGGIRQSFTYTSKGELETATSSQMSNPAIPMPGRGVGLTYDGQK